MPLDHLDFGVSIVCDGKELPQYGVTKEGSVASCYVPSEPGKTFEVHCEDYVGLYAKRYRLFMDGRAMPLHMRLAKEKRQKRIWKGARGPDDSLLSFRFSTVQSTDDENAAGPSHGLADIGVILVTVHRVTYRKVQVSKGSGSAQSKSKMQTVPAATLSAIPEKTKLMGSHCVELGPPIGVSSANQQRASRHTYKDIDPRESPYVQFRIHHLSEDVLRARGIIPADETVAVGVKRPRSRELDNPSKRPAFVQGASTDARHDTKRPMALRSAGPLTRRDETPVKTEHMKKERAERATSSTGDTHSEARIRQLEDNLQTIQAELARVKAEKRGEGVKPEREDSPIAFAREEWDDEVIDLTED